MKPPENLESLSKEELIEMVKQLFATVAALQEEVSDLKRQLNQNSGNSSRPPSSDFGKGLGKLKKAKTTRPKGPPKGHDGVTRFGFGEPDKTVEHTPETCTCGQSLQDEPNVSTESWQVAELEKPVVVTEHRRHTRKCRVCGKENTRDWPEEVVPGQSIGPRLNAWLVYLHTFHNQSCQKLEDLCHDLLGLPMSQGTLQKLFALSSAALEPGMETLEQRVRQAQGLHCDETGWRCNGVRKYLWCAVTDAFSYFWVHAGRSRKALYCGIGESFQGACHSDFYSVYSCFTGQSCWAHLLRDVEASIESPNTKENAFALQLGLWMDDLWALWRQQKAGEIPQEQYLKVAAMARDEMLNWLQNQVGLPKKAARLQKRIVEQPERVFYFVSHPETPPDNNAAERALRGLVTNRKVTGGNRTEAGELLKTRHYSIIQTCRKQGLSAIEYIRNALIATTHTHSPYPTLFNSC